MSLVLAADDLMEITIIDGCSEEDKEKTEWLLKMYPSMIDVMKNVEFANEHRTGLSLYELMNTEGGMSKRLEAGDNHSDVTGNTVVLIDKRDIIYAVYASITLSIRNAVSCLYDPHQGVVADLLFIQGWRYHRAEKYMAAGYREDIYPIQATTFAEKRRKALKSIMGFLKMNGVLDVVALRESPGEKPQYSFMMPKGYNEAS